MKFYGIESEGEIRIERCSELSLTKEEARLVYSSENDEIYLGKGDRWQSLSRLNVGSSGTSGHSELSGVSGTSGTSGVAGTSGSSGVACDFGTGIDNETVVTDGHGCWPSIQKVDTDLYATITSGMTGVFPNQVFRNKIETFTISDTTGNITIPALDSLDYAAYNFDGNLRHRIRLAQNNSVACIVWNWQLILGTVNIASDGTLSQNPVCHEYDLDPTCHASSGPCGVVIKEPNIACCWHYRSHPVTHVNDFRIYTVGISSNGLITTPYYDMIIVDDCLSSAEGTMAYDNILFITTRKVGTQYFSGKTVGVSDGGILSNLDSIQLGSDNAGYPLSVARLKTGWMIYTWYEHDGSNYHMYIGVVQIDESGNMTVPNNHTYEFAGGISWYASNILVYSSNRVVVLGANVDADLLNGYQLKITTGDTITWQLTDSKIGIIGAPEYTLPATFNHVDTMVANSRSIATSIHHLGSETCNAVMNTIELCV